MGGLFTVVKMREGITSYEDPGWYDYPKGTVAWKVDGPSEDAETKRAHVHHHDQ